MVEFVISKTPIEVIDTLGSIGNWTNWKFIISSFSNNYYLLFNI